MAFAGEQPRGGIQPDPAGSRKVHFGPRVQIRKIGAGSGRSFERFHVRLELNQIAGNEPRRESQMAQDLHQQPGRIAARAAAQTQSFLAMFARHVPCE